MSTHLPRSRADRWFLSIAGPLALAPALARGAYGATDEVLLVVLALWGVCAAGARVRGASGRWRTVIRGSCACVGALVLWWNLYGALEAAWIRGATIPATSTIWYAVTASSMGSVLLDGGRLWVDPGGGSLVFRATLEKTGLLAVCGWGVIATALLMQRDGYRFGRSMVRGWLRGVALPCVLVSGLGASLMMAVFASVYDPLAHSGGTVLQVFHHRWTALLLVVSCAWISACLGGGGES